MKLIKLIVILFLIVSCSESGTSTDDESDSTTDVSAIVYSSLINTTVEPPGENCEFGGLKIETGIDNGDGGEIAGDDILQPGEVDNDQYVCNGAPGDDGNDGEDSTSDTIYIPDTIDTTTDIIDVPDLTVNLSGKFQKGPCPSGGEVLIQPIDPLTMYQTGGHFIGVTIDDLGSYYIPAEMEGLWAEVFFKGSCHDELNNGFLRQEFSGIIKKSDPVNNINPLTHVASYVARWLFGDQFLVAKYGAPNSGTEGDIESSMLEAESRIISFIQMPAIDERFTEMNLENSGTHDAILAMFNSMILDQNEGDHSSYMISIAVGVIENDLALKQEIADTFTALPLIQIIRYLKAIYLELELSIEIPPIWRLGAPDYYADLLEREPEIQISHNLELTGSCSFDQNTYNTFATPIVFEAEILTSNYFASNFPPDSQVSIWTKSADAYPVPETKLQDFTALKEIIIEPVMNYNGMIDSDNMPVVGEHYYLVIRKDEDFVLSKNCTPAGPALPFGQVLASDDEMETWIGFNMTDFFTRGIKYFTVN